MGFSTKYSVYFSFSMKSRSVASGCSVCMNVSPIRKPLNPAERNFSTVSGLDIPLSETNRGALALVDPAHIPSTVCLNLSAIRNEFSISVTNVPRLRLFTPTMSVFLSIYDNSWGLCTSSRTSSPSAWAFSVRS